MKWEIIQSSHNGSPLTWAGFGGFGIALAYQHPEGGFRWTLGAIGDGQSPTLDQAKAAAETALAKHRGGES